MLELRHHGASIARLRGRGARALLSLRTRGSNFAKLSGLFGKRIKESEKEGITTPISERPLRVISWYREFSYGAFDSRQGSQLSFLRVQILDRDWLALLDSGSSRTFIGPTVLESLNQSRISIPRSTGGRVITATGQSTKIRGELSLPLTLNNKTRTVRACALPTLALSCILGVDFLAASEFVLISRRGGGISRKNRRSNTNLRKGLETRSVPTRARRRIEISKRRK